MDIKLMRNSEKGIFYSINDRLLMQITDDNYQYQGLQGKKYFILNAATNEKFEVASQIKKYNFCKVKYACLERNYMFFTSLESVTESRTLLTVYRFMFDTNENEAFVQSNGTHVIPGCPEVPVAELVLQIPVFFKDHHCRFPFQVPHKAGDAILRRDTQQQMHMVRHHMTF